MPFMDAYCNFNLGHIFPENGAFQLVIVENFWTKMIPVMTKTGWTLAP